MIKVLMLLILVAVVFVPLLDVFAPTGPSAHPFTAADVLLRTTIAGLVVVAAAALAMRWPQLCIIEFAVIGRASGIA